MLAGCDGIGARPGLALAVGAQSPEADDDLGLGDFDFPELGGRADFALLKARRRLEWGGVRDGRCRSHNAVELVRIFVVRGALLG